MGIKTVTIAQNSLYALLSSVAQKILTLCYFIIVARVFGPADQGRYSAALAFTMLFNVLIDLGIASVLTRETARTPEKASLFVSQMILSRLAIGIIVYGIILVSAYSLGYPHEFIALLTIAGTATIFDAFSVAFWAVFRGFRNLLYESIGGVLAICVMIIGGLFVIFFQLPIYFLMFAVLAGSFANTAYAVYLIIWKVRLSLVLSVDWKTMRILFLFALPFMGSAIFSRLYTFSDTAILAKMAGDQYAGWYSAANKLVLALNLVPASLSASLFPVMSAYFIHDPRRIGTLYVRALTYLFLIALPMGIGIAITAYPIVTTLYSPSYLPTVDILRILSISIIFGFLIYPPGAVLAAVNRQRANTVIFGCAAAINIGMNMYLIPLLDARGSAIASVASSLFIFLASFSLTFEYWRKEWRKFIISVGKICVASFFMGVLVFFSLFSFPLIISLIVGVASYVIFVFLFRIIPTKECSALYHSIFRRYEKNASRHP